MTAAAPRLDVRLLTALSRLDRGTPPIAEVNRRIGALAQELHLPRPSYEQVRVAVHAQRRLGRFPSSGEVLLDIAARSRPPGALVEVAMRRADRRPKPK